MRQNKEEQMQEGQNRKQIEESQNKEDHMQGVKRSREEESKQG
jgi:hypothetical protein